MLACDFWTGACPGRCYPCEISNVFIFERVRVFFCMRLLSARFLLLVVVVVVVMMIMVMVVVAVAMVVVVLLVFGGCGDA